jgi:hypothetical protein
VPAATILPPVPAGILLQTISSAAVPADYLITLLFSIYENRQAAVPFPSVPLDVRLLVKTENLLKDQHIGNRKQLERSDPSASTRARSVTDSFRRCLPDAATNHPALLVTVS